MSPHTSHHTTPAPTIVVAPDSFKGSLDAAAAAQAIARGIRTTLPEATIHIIPMADGGEGTVAAALGGLPDATAHTVTVAGPLLTPTRATYALRPATATEPATAVVDAASACGLHLIPDTERTDAGTPTATAARTATSRGLGELCAHVLDHALTAHLAADGQPGGQADRPALRLIIGLGGTATTDGGLGALLALGARISVSSPDPAAAEDTASDTAAITDITDLPTTEAQIKVDLSGLDPRWEHVEVELACDVDNPLTGPRGAAQIFGPQKGLSDADIPERDRLLHILGTALCQARGTHPTNLDCTTPGGGAAGGLGLALMAALGATMTPGAGLLAQIVGLPQAIAAADLVITGEGRIDGQTAGGKTPWGVAQLAHAAGVPTIALAGSVDGVFPLLTQAAAPAPGFAAVLPIVPGPIPLAEAIAPKNAAENLAHAAAMAMRLITIPLNTAPAAGD